MMGRVVTNLLHIKSGLWFSKGNSQFKINKAYRAEYKVVDIVPLGNDRLCLVYKTSIFQEDDSHIYDLKNAFLIKNLRPEEVTLFDALHHHPKHRQALFMDLSKKMSILWHNKQSNYYEMNIPGKLGAHYGQLSGDMNFLHSNSFIAKLIGYKGAFSPGLCTLNLLLSTLTSIGYDHIEKLNITFCHKIYENQVILLLINDQYYELVDSEGTLLAYGRLLRYSTQSP